ncbi:MAG: hypothetical protein ABFS35_06550 [Bacteroidota bacterium]
MSLLKRFFSKNTENDDNNKKELLLQKIEKAISNCKLEIEKSNTEIEQIKKWIAEIIHDNFHVPGDFWYEELTHYPEIKKNKENQSVAKETIIKSDELIKEYQSQIKFRETKKELNEMTIVKYQESKQKILDLDLEVNKTEVVPDEPDKFQKHKNRLLELSQNPNNLDSEQKPQKQLQSIIDNVNELIENHKIEEEVQSFMQKLNEQFNIEMKNYDQNRLINEMEKLIEVYKTKK